MERKEAERKLKLKEERERKRLTWVLWCYNGLREIQKLQKLKDLQAASRKKLEEAALKRKAKEELKRQKEKSPRRTDMPLHTARFMQQSIFARQSMRDESFTIEPFVTSDLSGKELVDSEGSEDSEDSDDFPMPPVLVFPAESQQRERRLEALTEAAEKLAERLAMLSDSTKLFQKVWSSSSQLPDSPALDGSLVDETALLSADYVRESSHPPQPRSAFGHKAILEPPRAPVGASPNAAWPLGIAVGVDRISVTAHERREREERHKAATSIQKIYRGFRVRKKWAMVLSTKRNIKFSALEESLGFSAKRDSKRSVTVDESSLALDTRRTSKVTALADESSVDLAPSRSIKLSALEESSTLPARKDNKRSVTIDEGSLVLDTKRTSKITALADVDEDSLDLIPKSNIRISQLADESSPVLSPKRSSKLAELVDEILSDASSEEDSPRVHHRVREDWEDESEVEPDGDQLSIINIYARNMAEMRLRNQQEIEQHKAQRAMELAPPLEVFVGFCLTSWRPWTQNPSKLKASHPSGLCPFFQRPRSRRQPPKPPHRYQPQPKSKSTNCDTSYHRSGATRL